MKKQIILWGIMTVMAVSAVGETTGTLNVKAAVIHETCEITAEYESIVPYADVIVRKYRVINGVTQYRRWNETKGYWVDSDWITL